MWQDNDSAYNASTMQWWATIVKEWNAWEILVNQTIGGLEQMTKNPEMKWGETKGNRNMSIKPLSSSSDIWSPVWGNDRGWSSTRSNRVWIKSGTTHVRPSKLDKKGKVEDKSFQQLPLLFYIHYPPNVFICYSLDPKGIQWVTKTCNK